MTAATATNPLADLRAMLSASRQNYEACIGHVQHQHTCAGVTATTRMHHLKFDPNGQLKVEALAECLADHITAYAVSSRNRAVKQTEQDWAKFVRETRRMFRVNALARGLPDLSGEAGEMLLYFLLEAVLQAPQVVAKVELKTNPAMEVNGSDGIHMRWDAVDNCADVYFGESKLYTDVGAALTNAFESIEKFHANGMRQHEFAMATRHFKGVDDRLKAAIREVLDSGKPPPDARINHACLIGYEWTASGLTPMQAQAAAEAAYQQKYLAEAPRLHLLLQNRFEACQRSSNPCGGAPCRCQWKRFRFEVFFLPFASVQAFRDAFTTAME